MLESKYQSKLITRLEDLFPGCYILKQDPEYLQGIPDLLILFNDRWAFLEVKASLESENQPNQDYYVNEFDNMSFAAFICPENEEEILDALQQAFRS